MTGDGAQPSSVVSDTTTPTEACFARRTDVADGVFLPANHATRGNRSSMRFGPVQPVGIPPISFDALDRGEFFWYFRLTD
jgi:hypothetical protein